MIGMAFANVMRTKPIPIMKLNASARRKALSRADLEVVAAICPAIGSHSLKIGEVKAADLLPLPASARSQRRGLLSRDP